jgi:tetratricopeptide (TPR) repeat protein
MSIKSIWQKNIHLLFIIWTVTAFALRPGWTIYGLGCLAWLVLVFLTAPAVFWNYLSVLIPNPAKSEGLLKKALASEPGFADPYAALALIYVRRKQWAEAIPLLDKAIPMSSAKISPQLRLHLAVSNRELQQYQQALEILEQIKPVGQIGLAVYMNRAIIYHRLGKYPEALESADKARSFDITSAHPVLVAGRVHFDMGDFSAAKDDYLWALEHISWPVESYYWLGRAELELGQTEAAVEHLSTAVERITEDPLLSDVTTGEAQNWLEKAKSLKGEA